MTQQNFSEFREDFRRAGHEKYFYSAIRSRLMEFDGTQSSRHAEYLFNSAIAERARVHGDKVILFVFVDGTESPNINDPISYLDIVENGDGIDKSLWPRTYAFY